MTALDVLAFAIETSDEHWIKRNKARIDDAGHAIVMLPAGELELVTIGLPPHAAQFVYLRGGFAKGNYPRNLQHQSSLWCPAGWVPETAAHLAAKEADQ